MLKFKFFLDELSFSLWRSLHSGGGGEIREKVGRVALGTRKGSGPRMRGRIAGWLRGVVGTRLLVVGFVFLAGWPTQQLIMGTPELGKYYILGGHCVGPILRHPLYLSGP